MQKLLEESAESQFESLLSRVREHRSRGRLKLSSQPALAMNDRSCRMDTPRAAINLPTGLAFEIADLLLLKDWSDQHGIQMVVELDHCVEGEEYEEVVAFYAKGSPLRRWILWRAPCEIVVQPLIGRGRRFASVTDALATLSMARR